MHDNGQNEAHGIDHDMAFAAGDLLAGIISTEPPFSVVLTLWLSMMAALGVRFLPAFCRTFSRSLV